MSNGDKPEDYKVGYGKPPKSRRFKKGVSGNPSGRPKKPTDSGSVLMRELDSKLTINEKGQRKVITKLEGIWKQSVNKAVTGDPKSARLVFDHLPRADESAAEQQQNSPNTPDTYPIPEHLSQPATPSSRKWVETQFFSLACKLPYLV